MDNYNNKRRPTSKVSMYMYLEIHTNIIGSFRPIDYKLT